MSSSPHYDAQNPPEVLYGPTTFKPRQLNIVWGNDTRYWKMPTRGKDDEPAELLQVCWLEVSGNFPSAEGTKYQISFTISFKPDAFGWNNCPVYVMAKLGKKGKYLWKKETLQPESDQGRRVIGGLEITGGKEETIFFGLYEVWSGKWKGGLKLHEATVTKV